MITSQIINQRLNLPLEIKIEMSKKRVLDWYNYWHGNIYLSFSGGKDSLVLYHLIKSLNLDIEVVFSNTGLEFPEIINFVKSFDNIKIITPKHNFKYVVNKYGYPIISKEISEKIYQIRTTKSEKLKNIRLNGYNNGHGKISEKWKFLLNAPFKISHYCCNILKKQPFYKYENITNRKSIIGNKILDSRLRYTNYIKHQCNNYNSKRPKSHPLSFWKDKDVWNFINQNNIPYCSIYDKGYDRTGCFTCLFGIQSEKGINRIQNLKYTHPKLYKFCIDELKYNEILDYLKIPYK